MTYEAGLIHWAMRENEDATRFCEQILFVAHLWDDLVDGDEAGTDRINRAFWTALVDLPGNPFYQRHYAHLAPVIRRAAGDWMDANDLEKGASHDRSLAFVLRDAVHGVIIEAAYLVGGYDWMREVSMVIRRKWHDETLDEYVDGLWE